MSYNNNSNQYPYQGHPQHHGHHHHHHHSQHNFQQQQQQQPNNQSQNLRETRNTNRRLREDDWQDELTALGAELNGQGNNNHNNNVNQTIFNTNANDKVIRIGVNQDHRAPFLPVATNEPLENENEEDSVPVLQKNENLLTANSGKHTTLVWPAKDPQGRFAKLALQGSETMKEFRKRKIEKQTVRAKIMQQQEDEPQHQQQQQQRKIVSVAATHKNPPATEEASEEGLSDEDEGGDEEVIHNFTSKSKNNIITAGFSQQEEERLKIREQRERLPTFAVRDLFIDSVRENSVIVVQGETGSGKSTQLPQYLLEERFAEKTGPGIIACTQPRRVAAIGLARRVSQEVGCEVGDIVGYAVRLEDVTSERTRLKFMTDGVLLREAVKDPMLNKYNVLVLDEAHERSIDTDVLLGVVKTALRKRRNLKVVLMSATMQIEKFSNFFNGAPIFEVSGRTFPVNTIYSPNPVEDYVKETILQVVKVHVRDATHQQRQLQQQQQQQQQEQSTNQTTSDAAAEKVDETTAGDILVFMTGEEDVRCVCELLRQKINEIEDEMQKKIQMQLDISKQTGKPPPVPLKLKKLDIIPCFSTILVNKEQLDRVLNPSTSPAGIRKCVVATNVAETSLTIDGITTVIDCGFMKCKVFKPRLGAHPLLPFPVSQAQATQRAGRAGRTREGTCYRLYTEEAFKREMLESPVPEIKRSSIDRVCLFVKAIGIDNVESFDFIDKPPTEIIHKSLYSLWLLGALDDEGKITPKGKSLAELPVEPAMGVVLLTSKALRCTRECLNIAAMLSVDTRALFAVPRDKEDEAMRARDPFTDFKSDHITLFNILSQFLFELEQSGGGEFAARKWAEKTFLSYSVLKTAAGIRQQLHEQVGKLLHSYSSSANIIIEVDSTLANLSFKNTLDAVRFCVVSGFFPQCAQKKKVGEYTTILTRVTAQLPPTSALGSIGSTAEFVVFNELAMTTERSFLSVVTVAEPEWLVEASRGLFFIRGQQQQQQQIPRIQTSEPVPPPNSASVLQQQQQQQQSTLSFTAALLQAERDKFAPAGSAAFSDEEKAKQKQTEILQQEQQTQQQQAPVAKPKFVPKFARK